MSGVTEKSFMKFRGVEVVGNNLMQNIQGNRTIVSFQEVSLNNTGYILLYSHFPVFYKGLEKSAKGIIYD